MIELRLNLFNCSMADKGYQKALMGLIREVLGEIIDDAVGLAEWKLKQMVATPQIQYGTGEFPSDSGSPLSTFSSTPSSSPNTLAFTDLAGTQLTDEDTEKDQKETEKLKDESLVKYLIGDISESESERENLPDPRANLHDNTNPHEVTELRTPMIPIDVNVIVETTEETEKSKNRVASKGKKKIISRGDHSVAKQKEICKEYIKKGKDLSKLKAHIERQKEKTKRKVNFSMPKRKKTKMKMIAEREAEMREREVKDHRPREESKNS